MASVGVQVCASAPTFTTHLKKMKNTSLTTKTYELDKPMQMVKMATLLKNHIVKNELYDNIKGKNYVRVEGWQFGGGMMGLYAKIVKVEEMGKGKWFAQAEVVDKKTQVVVGSGFALCSKEEDKKKSFDEYAILSMAQTRAIGKAYRNLIGWVMKLAGYESTPAEEIKNGNGVKTEKTQVKDILAGPKEKQLIESYCKKLGADDPDKAYELIKKLTGIELNLQELTKNDAMTIITKLLEKLNSNRNEKRN